MIIFNLNEIKLIFYNKIIKILNIKITITNHGFNLLYKKIGNLNLFIFLFSTNKHINILIFLLKNKN